jgi:NADPH:quinone reductase-like Zn-dependent oxidoreductase
VLAARVHAFGVDPVLDEVAEPVPAAGEHLVEIGAAALGHIDLTVLTGEFVARPELPYVPGTDGAGVVVETGEHVRIRGGGLGLTRDGTWRGRATAPTAALHPVPADVDVALAASFFSPATTAHVAVHELGELAAGERVAVTGATGAVGSLAAQLALRAGAAEVQALVGRPEKVGLVARGARVVDAPDRVDLLIDTVGGAALPQRIAGVRPGGRAVLVGYTAGTDVTFALPSLLATAVRLLPLSMLEWGPRIGARADELLTLLQRGELTLPVERRPLRELAGALADLRSGRVVGRIVLVP